MLRHVVLVRTDVSEELIASIIRLKRFGELETTLAVTKYCSILEYSIAFPRSLLLLLVPANAVSSSLILVTLMMEEIRSSERSVHTRAIRRNIPEGDIFLS
jgi:hypothetical protein